MPPAHKPVDVDLSDAQIALMRVLWSQGECTIAECGEALGRDLAHTTVATMLTRLEKRGVIASRRDGRQLVYKALVDEPSVRRSKVSGLLGSLFGGDAKALVAHLVREDEMAAGDLAEIRKLLARKERDDA